MSDDRDPRLNFPSNSHKKRDEKKPDKKIEQVTQGEAVKRKKPLGRKIAETFAGDDARSVGSYILFDVVIPAAKSMISDAVSQGIERMLFGGDARTRKSGLGGGHTSYNRMYRGDRDPVGRREISQKARSQHDFDEIIIPSRGEAEMVVDRMNDLIEGYDVATVSDLYEMVGITGNYTDDKWGWTDLRGTSVRRVREGFLIELPRPVYLE